MKKIRNNWWNRMFHKKALAEYIRLRNLYRRQIGWCPQMLQDLKEAKTLEELMAIHVKAWHLGFQNTNLAPCEWGMFRTKNIIEMKPSEVYLGGIWGLLTKPIPFWNENRTETMAGNGFGIDPNTKIYDLIMHQYKRHLESNFEGIAKYAADQLMRK